MKSRLAIQNSLKQAALIIICSLLTLAVSGAEDPVLFQSLKLGDTVVKNVRVKEATPTFVVITYDGGGSKLKRKDLPAELKSLYPYDAKEAAAYEQQQAAAQAERSAKAKARQDEANRLTKIDLQRQKQAIQDRIDLLSKELAQLEEEMAPMKGKAKGKPKSEARKELDAARDNKEGLIHRIGEQKTALDKINKRLDGLP